MNTWTIGKSFKKQHYLKKKEFYSSLNLEDITDADYMKAKRVCKNFEIKNLGEYYDLYLKTDVILLADVFRKLQKNVLRSLSSRPCKIYFSSRFSLTSGFKKQRS